MELILLAAGVVVVWLAFRVLVGLLRLLLFGGLGLVAAILLFHVPLGTVLHAARGLGTVRLPSTASLTHVARAAPGWVAEARRSLHPLGVWYLHTGERILHSHGSRSS